MHAPWITITSTCAFALLLAPGCAEHGPAPITTEVVFEDGDPIVVLTANGAWSWFQDERAIVDPVAGTLLVGSVADDAGAMGSTRRGDVDVTRFRFADEDVHTFTLHDDLQDDDHNAPALLVRPDGRYLAAYTAHNTDRLTHFRISTHPHDATAWEPDRPFDWSTTPGSDFNVTYSNLFYLLAERRTYDIARANNRSPNLLVSDDDGSTWTYRGPLLYTAVSVGYVNGYMKYASNGIDRIHLVATEHHPLDYDNGLYHGYLEGGQLFGSDGTLVDDDIFDGVAPSPIALTPVFVPDPEDEQRVFTRAWPTDLALDAEGHPHALFTVRAHDHPTHTRGVEDHRFLYARYEPGSSAWIVHELAWAGARLYPNERDYTGLGALHPRDPSLVYLSTPIDPRSGVALPHHEIFEGFTTDGGATWRWTALTWGSPVDNLRPIVPEWDSENTAIVWLRGTYGSMRHYDLAVVGIMDRTPEALAL